MNAPRDEELEALLRELAPDEASRAKLLEEHRLMEHDLSRLGDPLPPSDFVAQVMKKVEAAPARPMSRSELVSAASIFSVVLAAGVGLFIVEGRAAQSGSTLAAVLVAARETVFALGNAMQAVWQTAALPVVLLSSAALLVGLVGVRRLASSEGVS